MLSKQRSDQRCRLAIQIPVWREELRVLQRKTVFLEARIEQAVRELEQIDAEDAAGYLRKQPQLQQQQQAG